MKVSFVATVFNEEKTIDVFLKSIFSQSRMPDEIIIVDGGSTDSTVAKIKNFSGKSTILIKKGNRSVGRNEAIKRARNEIIVCSDAGCVLDKNWVKNIIKPFNDPKVDVVAGYYKGKPKNIFQKCLIPYVLTMSDKINIEDFLPATRSMAFRKSIWKKAGGFDEKYSHNEDYVFAKRLREIRANIFFEKKAIVSWTPLGNIKNIFKMFFRFAFGDAESGILREKVIFIFVRYILSAYVLLLSFLEKSPIPLYTVILGLFFYILWSIKKNYRYVENLKAFFFLPLLQFTSDFAVMFGTGLGFLKRIINLKKIYSVIKANKWTLLIIGLYAICMLMLINWGIPNANHPFDYFMDEWHQAQAVRAVFTQGSPNIPGAANGSMFHFLLSGLLLIPFIVAGIVNPFVIKSSVENLEIQQKLFQVLRFNTLFFGIISIIIICYIAKKYFKLNPILISFLFVVNPIWLTLSNYFKYDIALIFWISLSFLCFLRYSVKTSIVNYALAAFVAGLAFSVKVSALPLLPILFILYFIFNEKRKENLKHLIIGAIIFISTFLIFGIPDLLLGKGNINEYLYDNLIRTPGFASNYILGTNYIFYLIFKGASTVFGYFLFFLSGFAVIFTVVHLFKNKLREMINKRYFLVLISLFIFIFSITFLKIEARGNRLLVLLPFMILLSGFLINKLIELKNGYLRKIVIFIFIIFFLFQTIESFLWINLKLKVNLRQSSSVWIVRNIPFGTEIGIENIPIYQFLPDAILKDYYLKDRNISVSTNYRLVVIDDKSSRLPSYVILTNENIAKNYMVSSPKKDLLNTLEKEDYKKIYYVEQDAALFNILRDRLDYFMSGLIQEPLSISVYKSK